MSDGKVERVMKEVLLRLENDDGLTICPVDDHAYTLTESDLVRDLEIFAEVFDGEVRTEGNSVFVKFRNGQTFRISVEEKF